MSLNHEDISLMAKEAAAMTASMPFISCHECGKGRFLLLLEGDTLLFCLEEPFLRFHRTEKKGGKAPTSFFAKTVNTQLEGFYLTDVSSIPGERIVVLEFSHPKQKAGCSLILELFEKRPNGFLLDSEGKIITAHHSVTRDYYSLPDKPLQCKTKVTALYRNSTEVEAEYLQREQHQLFEKEQKRLSQAIKSRVKRLQKTKCTYHEQLRQANLWEHKHHEAELLQANLYNIPPKAEEITVEDWLTGKPSTLKLDNTIAPHQQAALWFRQSKKLKRAIFHLEEQIKKIESQLLIGEKRAQELSSCLTLPELETFAKKENLQTQPTKTISKTRRLPYKIFLTSYGAEIRVGKNARDNEALTFQHANGSDWWFHASGCSGSHVILHIPKNRKPHDEEIRDAEQLALAYSKAANEGAGEVIMTQKKYVTRQGNRKIGQVQVSHHKKRYVKYDSERIDEIKNRRP